MIVLVMGVSGSGKSTVGRLVADRLGWEYIDADAYHSPENIAKMRDGQALTDEDRREWIATLADIVERAREGGHSIVLGCSALKRAYRDAILDRRRDDVLLVHLAGTAPLIHERMEARQHFMSPATLESQFAALEPPQASEQPLVLDIRQQPEALAAAVLDELQARSERA